METKRPIGVTIIAILAIIGGILLLFGGIAFVALAPILSQINMNDNDTTSNSSISLNINGTDVTIPKNTIFIFGGFLGVIGVMLIVIGIASFVVAWGLLTGKGWAWIVTIIIVIISIILNIILIVSGSYESIIGLIIDGIIIYYLYRPSVKSYFGRVRGPTV
ncbi:MAG TPA: hypothetical protein VJS91_10160 [Nitrososphaeraceae archaeon]|nr:hypothetical protein [Nitrososphaeraceae archaeon]